MKAKLNSTAQLLLIAIVLALSIPTKAQVKLGDNKQTVNAGSLLELESSVAPYKGFLLTRIPLTSTGTWGLAGNAAAGMLVYNTNASIQSASASYLVLNGGVGMYIFDGTGWKALTTVSQAKASAVSNVLSYKRFPFKISNGYNIVIPDTSVTDDCTILIAIESDYNSPIYKIGSRTTGVGFTINLARIYNLPPPSDGSMFYVHYAIIKKL